jgi:serine/threonine protein phosphatase PrpC
MKGFTANGAWICHTGKLRKVNEDACFFGGVFSGASISAPSRVQLETGSWLIAVADGIGGHKAGAYASREVVAGLATCTDLTPKGVDHNLVETNRRLHGAGAANPDLSGTGAAVVGMLATDEHLYAFNVGDARLYRQEGGKLRQMTVDDSVEEMLVREGLMKAHGGIRPANLHALTQSVGGSKEYHEIEPHFYLLPMAARARFILCTDGLSDMLSPKDMERVVVPLLTPVAAVQMLFTAAMDAGGKDNITVAVVDVETAPVPARAAVKKTEKMVD